MFRFMGQPAGDARMGWSGRLTCLEICAGAGGQSLGLELAGFEPELAVNPARIS
jgi:hypothetical protein